MELARAAETPASMLRSATGRLVRRAALLAARPGFQHPPAGPPRPPLLAAAAGHDAGSGAAAAAAGWRRHKAAAAPAAAPAASGTEGRAPAALQARALPHLRDLSEEQLEAVTAPLGTVRVMAGPGSGKTRVLTSRIAHLVHVHGAQPWQVLAITFTNKAANEMRERLAAALGAEAGAQLFAGTFHSLCYRLLKRDVAQLAGSGRTPAFSVYDQDMSTRVLAGLVREAQPEWKARDVNDKAAELRGAIGRLKSGMLTWHAATPQAVEEAVRAYLATERGAADVPPSQADETATWFGKYEAALRVSDAFDFDDLLGAAVALLRAAPDVLARYRRRFRHVLVDEFQDTNAAQYELVKLLAAAPGADLFVVGDPDQAIYGWRGADPAHMTAAFPADFPAAARRRLADNYRSAGRIVATAAAVIAANEDGTRGTLRARRPAGAMIKVHVLHDSQAEARHVADEVQVALHSGEHAAEQVAVLFRTHVQARLVEQELVKRGIPFVLVGGVPFWRRVEVQDALAYLRLAVGLRDDLALARVINTPKRAIGEASVERLRGAAAAAGGSLCALLFGGVAAGGGLPPLPDRKTLGLTPKAAAAVEAFRELVASLHAAVAQQPLDRALARIISQTGYERHVRDGGCSGGGSKPGDELERLERLRQLVAAAAAYEPGQVSGAASLDAAFGGGAPAGGAIAALAPLQLAQNFLDEVALYSGVDEGGPAAPGVRLMTMHAAKGLEFELVFVPGCNEGLVPLMRGDEGADSLQEERRLFYVSLTRAKQRLHLLHTRHTSHYGPQSRRESDPSPFLQEVVQAGHAVVVEVELEAPWQSGSQRGRGGYGSAGTRQLRADPGSWQSGQRGGSRAASSSSSSNASSSSGSGSGRPDTGRSNSSEGTGSTPRPPPPPLSAAQLRAQRRAGRR